MRLKPGETRNGRTWTEAELAKEGFQQGGYYYVRRLLAKPACVVEGTTTVQKAGEIRQALERAFNNAGLVQ
jgi:hypothetical protein